MANKNTWHHELQVLKKALPSWAPLVVHRNRAVALPIAGSHQSVTSSTPLISHRKRAVALLYANREHTVSTPEQLIIYILGAMAEMVIWKIKNETKE